MSRVPWFLMSVLLLIAAVPLGCAERDSVGEPRGYSSAGERGADPLPKLSDIASMKATYYDAAQKRQVKFAVAQPHWSKIRDALMPARRDDHPAEWKVLGQLEIMKKGNGQVHVWLFSTSVGPGAFATGPTWEQRVYYRGGQSAKLQQALRAAYEASRQAP